MGSGLVGSEVDGAVGVIRVDGALGACSTACDDQLDDRRLAFAER
jgi:hypothetical protein